MFSATWVRYLVMRASLPSARMMLNFSLLGEIRGHRQILAPYPGLIFEE